MKKLKEKKLNADKNKAEKKEVVKDKDEKIIEGNPDVIKVVYDNWKFSKNILKKGPNWYLSEIVSK